MFKKLFIGSFNGFYVKIIAAIKRKKELSALSDSFVQKEVEAYLRRNPKASLENPRSSEFKAAVKDIRSRLRKVYGLFREGNSKILKNLSAEEQIMAQILNSHSSTRERMPYYRSLYEEIFKITKKPKKLLDVGCGINPFSVAFMGCKPEYFAYDLSSDEIDAVNQYFKLVKVKGKAKVRDVLAIKRFPKVDVAFIWKMTDMFDRSKGHKKTEEVLTRINSKYLVVSFATKTMSGKEMNVPRRPWFERMCKRLNWTFEVLEFPNELFYVVKQQA